MQATEMETGVQNNEKRFHPLYLWGIIYVLMTYGYPVLWFLTLPKADETVTSDAAYKEFARAQNGALGENLPFVFLGIPIVLLLINIILAIAMKKTGRRYFLNTARIIKYLLIPFFIMGGLLILAFFLFMFTPVVIMVFVSPMIRARQTAEIMFPGLDQNIVDELREMSSEGQKEWYALDHCHDNHAVYLWTRCLGNHSLRD